MSVCQVLTTAPDGSQQRYLGSIGPVSGLTYSFTLPGGCDQLTLTLGKRPDYRDRTLDPGRIVRVIRGGGSPWDGKLDEPAPSGGVWQVTAHGSGTFGGEHAGYYTGAWGAGVIDNAVNAAITRGLPWTNPGIGSPSGLWLGQPQDPASMMIDDLLNLACTGGGLTWTVRHTAAGNVLQLLPLPVTPTHLLVVTDPQPRTLGGDVNRIYIRYCTAPAVGTTPAQFATTSVVNQASINLHGEMETFADISSAGPMLATDAQAVGNFVLQRYQRAAYAGSFTARPGQLLTLGGQPVDPAFFYAAATPMVVRLIMLDQGWGGELTPGPVQFAVGSYSWDDDLQVATLSAFGSIRENFAQFLTQEATMARGRKYVINPHGRATYTYTTTERTIGHGKGARHIFKTHKHRHWHPTWHWR